MLMTLFFQSLMQVWMLVGHDVLGFIVPSALQTEQESSIPQMHDIIPPSLSCCQGTQSQTTIIWAYDTQQGFLMIVTYRNMGL